MIVTPVIKELSKKSYRFKFDQFSRSILLDVIINVFIRQRIISKYIWFYLTHSVRTGDLSILTPYTD